MQANGNLIDSNNEENIKLFNESNDDLVLPTKEEDVSTYENKSTEFENAISGNTVSQILIKQDSNINIPNYVIDFSADNGVSAFQKCALSAIIDKNGDIPIYLYNGEKLIMIGHGLKFKLETVMPDLKKHVLNSKVKIYRDLDSSTGEVTEVNDRDISKMRLNL